MPNKRTDLAQHNTVVQDREERREVAMHQAFDHFHKPIEKRRVSRAAEEAVGMRMILLKRFQYFPEGDAKSSETPPFGSFAVEADVLWLWLSCERESSLPKVTP